MAKRTNIIRIIKDEIKKGNIYVATNGNFVSADMLELEILADFKSRLDNRTIDMSTSFIAFKEDRLKEFTSAADVLSGICKAFHLVNVDTDNAEVASDDQSVTDMPEPSPETKPKRGKTKGGEAV